MGACYFVSRILALLCLIFSVGLVHAEEDVQTRSLMIEGVILQGAESSSVVSGYEGGSVSIDICLEVPNSAKLACLVGNYIGCPLTIEMLNELTGKIECHYINSGYPLVSARLLAGQDVTNGVVRITVLVGRLGCVDAQGACWFSNERIAGKITTKPGEIIRTNQMKDDLYWINDNPFRSTSLVYEKGENVGETNVILDTKDRIPFRPFVGYQNTGNKIAGRSRYFAGFNWGNVWGLDHQLNYQYTRATILHHYWAHSAGYTMPFPWRHIFKAFAFYSQTQPHMDHKMHLEGKSWQLSGKYEIPFVVWGARQHFFLGYDFKRANNFLSFVADTVYNTYIDVSQFSLGYHIHAEGGRSIGNFEAELVWSPGDMTKFNKNKFFEKERSGVKSQYLYGRMDLELKTPLFWRCFWRFVAKGQFTQQKLLPSEEFSVGGYLSVRGYLENQYVGDKGILLRNELLFPSINFGKGSKRGFGELQFLAFVDYGRVYDADSNIRHRDGLALASVGPGLRYHWGDNINVFLDYGFQLKKALKSSERGSSRLHLGATLAY